jgi:hypothetical protein
MLSFAGFPLGGGAAWLLTGPVDAPISAIAGGLVTGLILGVVQAWAMRADRRLTAEWTVATAIGLAVGLTSGAALVGYATGLGDLAVQGAVSGAAVGLAQAMVLRSRLGLISLAWPVYLAAAWAAGWIVSTSIGIKVAEQFTVFGASGALTVALLTSVLPLLLRSARYSTSVSAR